MKRIIVMAISFMAALLAFTSCASDDRTAEVDEAVKAHDVAKVRSIADEFMSNVEKLDGAQYSGLIYAIINMPAIDDNLTPDKLQEYSGMLGTAFKYALKNDDFVKGVEKAGKTTDEYFQICAQMILNQAARFESAEEAEPQAEEAEGAEEEIEETEDDGMDGPEK